MKVNKHFLHKSIIAATISSSVFSTAQAAVLEEVMVTAQKRAQSVNDIGVSASALSGDGLKALGIEQSSDLGAMTPGLVTVNATSGGTPIFAIRGIGLDDFNANNTSGVGVYTDEVFASSPVYLSGQLFDIERVEVLKGPQGTLYGKNTTGGAINFISNKPSDEFEASIEAGYGSHETVDLTGIVSGPITDGIRGRIATNYVKAGEGWQEDVATGKEYGKIDKLALRGQLAFDISDNGDALLRAYYSEDNSIPESPHNEGAQDALLLTDFDVLSSPTNPSKVSVGALDIGKDEQGSGFALTVNYDFDAFQFISISSFDQYERVVLDNYDGHSVSTMELFLDEELEQWSQEFRLVSNSDGPLTWVTGVNISYEEVVENQAYFDDSFLVTDSLLNGSFDPADADANGLDRFITAYEQKTDSYGAYLHTETELNDSFKLIAGIRYSNDKRSFDAAATEDIFGDIIPVVSQDESNSEDAITGKIGLDWQANDELLVFSSVSTSYKSGSYYGAPIIDSDAWSYLEPEDILAFELGFKWSLLEGSMQLNGSVFKMEYENRQSLITYTADDFSNYVTAAATLDTTMINVPESETQGFELDVEWLATDQLSLRAGIAYLDSEVTKSPSAAELRGISGDIAVNGNATGDADFNGAIDGSEIAFVDAIGATIDQGTVLAQSPKWSYNASAAYEFTIGNNLIARLQTSYSWVDKQYAQLGDINAQYGQVKGANAQASIGADDERWLLTLWGRNITNEESETYSFSGFAGRTVYRQQPATYGITLNYNFH
ncbi:TonB-dependent receptor [Dasania sp. GY-MA-18]|uniref:TonB-dependent receptor n=1 Tax=Dasania phycosphaerae TaxID=2950436 RepID=A0A9J6RJ74_9GAMM|nr:MULTISPECIES: TonB-dependent receptor [Dasania]MCR8922087.1 TonB-dependent receptor [Dasania sp. GY-MA-18]MCZ0864515.1 TonB-dependent receptor [Dasania phycosphaerae]MCZ0868243.1 TonB-dependent receptor [Dasania phycosphaerae]